MLIKRYGEADFLKVRARMATLWLRQQNGLPLVISPKPAAAKKPHKPSKKPERIPKKAAASSTATNKPKTISPKVPTQYVPDVIASAAQTDKRITINGVSIGPGTRSKDIAHLLLLAYGSPKSIDRLSLYLSKKLTKTRFEQAKPFIIELYKTDGKFYKARYAEKLQQRKESRERNRRLKEEKLQEEKERLEVAEQNLRWQRSLQNRKHRGSENYFKLIYIPMGNKR
ncbi:MAG: hypothetical protein II676_00435 [Bacteroidales bacterium]|nr:hypothetical protein [Bacteroidales bacterium]